MQEHELDQLSDEQFWEHARALAHHAPPASPAKEYLECELSGGRCLIPLEMLDEVVPSPRRFAFLPATPRWMIGLAAWHGEIIAVIDLDAFLAGGTARSISSEGMLLIAQHEDTPVGLLVPAIGQSVPVEDSAISSMDTSWFLAERAALGKGTLAGAVILDMPQLLSEVVKHIEMTTSYG